MDQNIINLTITRVLKNVYFHAVTIIYFLKYLIKLLYFAFLVWKC